MLISIIFLKHVFRLANFYFREDRPNVNDSFLVRTCMDGLVIMIESWIHVTDIYFVRKIRNVHTDNYLLLYVQPYKVCNITHSRDAHILGVMSLQNDARSVKLAILLERKITKNAFIFYSISWFLHHFNIFIWKLSE